MGAPDYVSCAAGVRIWRVAPNLLAQLGGLLWAPNVKEPWPTGEECMAGCSVSPDHAPPHEECTCGIYAFYSPELAKEGGYWPKAGAPLFNRLVAGVIGAAGEIVLHESGLLAARATVEAIFTDGAPDVELPLTHQIEGGRITESKRRMSREVIADAYGVPVIDSRDYEAFCAKRGLIVFGTEDLEEPGDR